MSKVSKYHWIRTTLIALVLLAPFALPLISVVQTAQAATFGDSSTPAYIEYPATGTLGNSAAEPSLGTNWITGRAMAQAGLQTLRITFNDLVDPPTASFLDVSSLYTRWVSLDPILATDSETGVTYAGGLAGECSILAMSSNDGGAWDPMTNSCASPSFDHESIGAGPWKLPKPTGATGNRAVYYCAQASVAQCAVSYNDGQSFTAPVPVQCGYINPGLHGSVHVGANGNVFLPFSNCAAAGSGFALSLNNGLTWSGRVITGSISGGLGGTVTKPTVGFDPDVATTPTGWVYVGLMNGDGRPLVALTKNNGTSWTSISDVSGPYNIKVSTFHEMVAGDDNRAALAFLGTETGTAATAFSSASFTGIWHLYVAHTYDGGATWTTVRVSTDPVQRGCIWDAGGSNACRNLLDFMDAQVDADGRVLVAYADGCTSAACTAATGTPATSRAKKLTIARLTTGRGLFSANDVAGFASSSEGGVALSASPLIVGDPTEGLGATDATVGDVPLAPPADVAKFAALSRGATYPTFAPACAWWRWPVPAEDDATLGRADRCADQT